VVWLNTFGGLVTSKTAGGGDFTVVTHNVNADNADPSGTAREVASSGADVVALEELTENAVPVYEKELAATYPYHEVVGTVGLWSKYRMSGTEPVDIKLGWERAMRSTVATPPARQERQRPR
jgi:vancomycin resistance protein VanJ